MAGHSKWSNIKHRKGKMDAKRGAVFSKIGREISLAVREGGPDPSTNSRLKDAISKAKNANMPNDNIERNIKKAVGDNDTDRFEEIQYEGYARQGVAVIVKVLSDNKNKSAAEIRHLFDKYGGNLGTTGCVSFMFEKKGTIIISKEKYPDEDKVMTDVLEAGAQDLNDEDEVYEIETLSSDYYRVKDDLESRGYEFLDTSLGLVPGTWVKVEDKEAAEKIEKMIEALEDHDDVQEVFHNLET